VDGGGFGDYDHLHGTPVPDESVPLEVSLFRDPVRVSSVFSPLAVADGFVMDVL